MLLVAVFLGCIACSLIGTYVAVEKHRSPGEGLIFGLVLGPIGVLLEAMMPTGVQRATTAEGEPGEKELIDPRMWNEHVNSRAPKIRL